jgi:hypothetical protein
MSFQNIGIKKGETVAHISCANCDVDNDCVASNVKPNANGHFLQEFVYKIECEGCGQNVAFSVIEL